jgi:hypothetical protein
MPQRLRSVGLPTWLRLSAKFQREAATRLSHDD